MNSIKTVLDSRPPRSEDQLPTASKEVKAIDNWQLSEDDVDAVLNQHKDLMDEQFRGWHRSHLKRLGVARYSALAKESRQGRNPARYFSYLLRRMT